MSDSDTPTPRASGLWAQWQEHADVLAVRLDAWALVREKRLDCLDLDGAARARELAAEARAMAAGFAQWPQQPPADAERVRQIQALADATSAGERLMAGIRESSR